MVLNGSFLTPRYSISVLRQFSNGTLSKSLYATFFHFFEAQFNRIFSVLKFCRVPSNINLVCDVDEVSLFFEVFHCCPKGQRSELLDKVINNNARVYIVGCPKRTSGYSTSINDQMFLKASFSSSFTIFWSTYTYL